MSQDNKSEEGQSSVETSPKNNKGKQPDKRTDETAKEDTDSIKDLEEANKKKEKELEKKQKELEQRSNSNHDLLLWLLLLLQQSQEGHTRTRAHPIT